MKLDRNINADGLGKYELRNLRTGEIVADCAPGDEHEFFVIMLKDVNATPALRAYAASAHHHGDAEWASEVLMLADRSGSYSPFCKVPD